MLIVSIVDKNESVFLHVDTFNVMQLTFRIYNNCSDNQDYRFGNIYIYLNSAEFLTKELLFVIV